jgi:hypothetical protein
MKPYEIAEKIQQLETLYAESLANHVNYIELSSIWNRIKYLRAHFMLIEFIESISLPSQSSFG